MGSLNKRRNLGGTILLAPPLQILGVRVPLPSPCDLRPWFDWLTRPYWRRYVLASQYVSSWVMDVNNDAATDITARRRRWRRSVWTTDHVVSLDGQSAEPLSAAAARYRNDVSDISQLPITLQKLMSGKMLQLRLLLLVQVVR